MARRSRTAVSNLAIGVALLAGAVVGCADDEDPPAPEVPASEYCAAVDGWDPKLAAFELEVLAEINAAREAGATCGADEVFEPAPALRMDPALRCAARVHALDMATRDDVDNLDPEGLRYSDRAELAGYAGTARAQNIGAAQQDPEQLITAVLGSAGLCRTLMDPDADEIGVGHVLADEAEYPSYWVQVYGMAE